ncbi:FAD-binding oxidoreductase [Zobellella endophytica]|uniref:D-2-hydroxyglutarate dehydrogenase n=1 Tax=Zobellella endophytica TaxID=2116700 RepID=A0A2P7R0J5_9GAMM|nr:FAD-binding and (Fe-S)-binding domain-containing protein [Zobellella endophytica]PSJ43728.1 FAD-binding oxidoreductase [Zobellella endophytica]
MIPALTPTSVTQETYLAFLSTLQAQGFEGDINTDYGHRLAQATDNSIYQLLPQAVLYPRHKEDVALLARLAGREAFRHIVLSPRGGGTGTNGQSLSDGIVVDLSRFMNRILEINPEQGWARVEAGVVKDQLNRALAPHGLFFAPELSTSNRATIGGMINTDASGQGSVRYGKTRDHVLELGTVLLDGSLWQSAPLDDAVLQRYQQRDDLVGQLHRELDALHRENRELIESRFPKLNRCLTGYDLAHLRDENGRFDLNSLLCGSEGSLGFIVEARLRVLPLPRFATLVNIKYASFDHALRDAKALMNWQPCSIETVDSRVLQLAMADIVWDSVRDYFPRRAEEPPIRGINLVEYTGNSREEVERKVKALSRHLERQAGGEGQSFGFTLAHGETEIKKIWAMRKRAVGLLGNGKGERRPIPFVEDTAVPPGHLADFIGEFRAVLDRHGLDYGMFGHVDAGVLHVRPAIDMKDPDQEPLIRTITDEVVRLTQKYHGLLWGEHGKGVRSEYAPAFFGPLYPVLQRVKALFDPHNQLNPGKIATPAGTGAELLRIDGVPTRGQFDRQIPVLVRQEYQSALGCNGNGACYNFDPDDAMCPSWKATRQRLQSPKGRATLAREWLRLLAGQGVDPLVESARLRRAAPFAGLWSRLRNSLAKRRGATDFSHQVHEAMAGCLACKSCVSQCPIKVDIPDLRARFMELYYGRYLRPVSHYLVASLEHLVPWLAKWPAPYNWLIDSRALRGVWRRIGLVDSPRLSGMRLDRALPALGIDWATPERLASLSPAERDNTVVLVQDAFTSYFETRLVLDVLALLTKLGFRPLLAPFLPNGKPLHVHGFLGAFHKGAHKNNAMLRQLADFGVPLVGVDPSMTLSYRHEYAKALGAEQVPAVLLLQEWLVGRRDRLRALGSNLKPAEYLLLPHCTEKTAATAAIRDWQALFSDFNLTLQVPNLGCCGMAGTYGHETANRETSRQIYEQSWARVTRAAANQGRLVATGYSCRSQVKRVEGETIHHPLQVLLARLEEG